MPTQNPEDSESRTPISNGGAEYENQRLSRIAENRARLEALGLPKIASSLWGSAQKVSDEKTKTKKKRKLRKWKVEDDGDDDDEDNDYRPDEVEESLSSSNGEEANEDGDDYLGETSSGSRRKKVKTKGSKPKKKVPAKKLLSEPDYNDDDDALLQAIALSLQGSAGIPGVVHSGPSKCSEFDAVNSTLIETKGASHVQEDAGKKKKKKSLFSSRLQMTEDELVVHFFLFDDAWKEGITKRDIERVAIAHDFMWTEKELADMIHCFDSDGDGKASRFFKLSKHHTLEKQVFDNLK
ncbi:hypothetical protein I3843_13G030500 [Carya illinoinensis]|uniref:Uncharacterized protein n=1 Tax=Carya illinoinensis TaxID=32201 RepID=A0A922AN26_CARIL|nr:hypothetical protein I3760_13G031700 [Carya illinoinensis]KAG6680259.1 hypothetical protein I3842_13G032600 [Carya illinoinensis]KAG7948858.1 hypothetical protein I3843_13G030500 [Carya illinoinensis]